MKCPYCRVRQIDMTIHSHEGEYSVCRVCASEFGFRVQAVKAELEIQALNAMWQLPAKEVRR